MAVTTIGAHAVMGMCVRGPHKFFCLQIDYSAIFFGFRADPRLFNVKMIVSQLQDWFLLEWKPQILWPDKLCLYHHRK